MPTSVAIGIGTSFGGAGGGAAVIAAPFASVNGTGAYDSWSAEYAATPSVPSPVAFTASRQGYDGSGNTTTYLDTLYVTTRVRQPFPNQASNSALTVALSDYIYSTDTPSGSVVNNATLASPKPVANWVTPDRSVVGNTIGGTVVPVEVVAFHRNARLGRQVACCIWTISDGTNTITTSAVSSTVVSNRAGDVGAVLVYRMPETDITSLTALTSGLVLITVNCKVYPWIGTNASGSILDSEAQSARRQFAPRYFLKDATLAASPPFAYVSTTGNDGTGVVSTTAATAAANPFLTIAGAINGIHTALSATTGVDGAIIRVQDGTFTLNSTAIVATRTQKVAALTITRSPTSTNRASVIVQIGATAFRPRLGGSLVTVTEGSLRFTDITMQRNGTLAFTGEAGANLEVTWDDINFDANSTGNTLFSNAHGRWYGATITNMAASNSLLGVSGALQHRCFRGVTVDLNVGNITDWLTVGCALTRPNLPQIQTTASGAITAFSRVNNPNNGNAFRQPSETTAVSGYVVAQNVIEYISGTDNMVLRISGDSATANNTHVILHNNTIVGAFNGGRGNLFYDEGATARSSILMSCRGNIHTQINTKGDVFQADGTRIGNWAYLYGVGCQGEWSQYIDANSGGLGGSFAQAYAGRGSTIGTTSLTSTAAMANSNWTSFAAVTVTAGPTYSAGAGGGTYTLTSGSAPVKGIVETAAFSHDFAGTARPTTEDTAGAYVAP